MSRLGCTLGRYMGSPTLVHAHSILVVLSFQVILMGIFEVLPICLADNLTIFGKLKVKESKNGRLPMLSMIGFLVQDNVTGKGPPEY
uniref:Chlorophyll a-b binding protein, chloroplastic n=1 Tax=Solanum lycopersicum TaxID=4081 RepID=A0A3Q7IE73_SOLLC